MKYVCKFIRIGSISGIYYSAGSTNTVVVYGIGAPMVPDSGNLPDAPILLKHGVDIFVPDYIGYARSDGIFTPKNCIETFLRLFKVFREGCVGKNYYENTIIKLKYQKVIFIGRSLGGTYVPLLPRFNPQIQELAIFCPVVNSKSCGSMKGEETNEDFLRSMKGDGYHYLYRGILNKQWKKHLANKDDLSPMDNIAFLKDAMLFIAHGKKDACVHYSKSIAYYKKILQMFPNKKGEVVLRLYPKGDHGSSTTNQATNDFMRWLRERGLLLK